jgi:plastocyanin
MMSRLVILFSFFAAFTHAGSFAGQVELRDSREKTVLKGRDYSGVVLWLEPVNGKQSAQPGRASMVQKDKKFIPHVLTVRTGSVIDFPNQDPIFHNAFSNYSGQLFDVGLYKPGTTRSVTFARPGIVRVFCNIHPNMSAVIVVVDTPWYATSRSDGSFRIGDIPAGEYRVHIFHERATAEELKRLVRTVTIDAGELNAGTIAISETGYLPSPHLNKHGKPYTPGADTYKVMR